MELSTPVPHQKITPEPQPEINLPETPELPKKKPWFIISAILLILVLLGTTAFFIYQNSQLKRQISQIESGPTPTTQPSPTPDPTADWQTYTNQEYQYEFKCSPNSTHKVYLTQGDGHKTPYYEQGCNENQNQIRISVNKFISQEEFTLEEKIKELSGVHLRPADFKEAIISDYKIITYKTLNTSGQIEGNFAEILLNENKFIRLTGFSEQYFDQILSTFKFFNQESGEQNLPQVPLISTQNWQTVSNQGVSFQIPPYATCNDNQNCSVIKWNEDYKGHSILKAISVNVSDYQGGSRREQFLASHTEVSSCNPIYSESFFGQVKALRIAVDGGLCQGNSGGIVTVISNKFIVLEGFSYNSETREINLWDVRDTILSTFKSFNQ